MKDFGAGSLAATDADVPVNKGIGGRALSKDIATSVPSFTNADRARIARHAYLDMKSDVEREAFLSVITAE